MMGVFINTLRLEHEEYEWQGLLELIIEPYVQ